MQTNTCCFIGHRTICETEALTTSLLAIIEQLVVRQGVDTFLFGSKSRFNDLCWGLVTQTKEKHPHIKRVYVRAEYPHIDESYRRYLLERYEETYYPETLVGAGKAVYVKRNREMIDNSRFCIVYCTQQGIAAIRKSGTKTALDYAVKQGKHIIRLSAD